MSITAEATSYYQNELERLVEQNGEIHRWLLALGVSIGALMEVIDSSITNVALPHIQGNLGATTSEAAWVITAYAVANVITMPLAVWLGDTFGKKNYYIFSMVGFTLASLLCGIAPSLVTLVLARVLQGLFGGGLLAKAQAFLFESFPPQTQGIIQGLFGICVIVGPIIGPTLGGYLTDNLDWRWIFFINLPVGVVATLLCLTFLPKDMPKTEAMKKEVSVDWFGILTLSVMLGAFQYVLEKGQDEDWFSSPRIIWASAASAVAACFFIAQELTTAKPAVNLFVMRHRSVAIGLIYSALLGFVLYGMNYIIPNFAQSMLGYTALQAGVLQVPSSVVSAFMFPIIGAMCGKVDGRPLVCIGTALMAVSSFWLASLTLDTGWDQFLWPSILRGGATVMVYLPLTMSAVGGIPREDISAASAFLGLTRQMGGSIGIAAMTVILTRRSDFHRLALIEKLTPYSPDLGSRLDTYTGAFSSLGGDSMTQALTALNGGVVNQSLVLSYEDLCWILGMSLSIIVPLGLLLNSGKSKDGGTEMAMH